MLIESIFNSLTTSSGYYRIVYPFLKPEYFTDKKHKYIFRCFTYLNNKYNKVPSFADIKLLAERDPKISVEETEDLFKCIDEIANSPSELTEELAIDETEKWVKDRAVEIAVNDFISTLEKGGNRIESEENIRNALSIEFRVDVGHDYFENAEERLEYYLNEETKIPLDIDVLNQAFGGGLVKKAMFLVVGSTNIGKSIIAAHCSNSLFLSGKNVLYLSGEMIDKEVLKRNDASILDIDIDKLNPSLSKQTFTDKLKNIFKKNHGKLIVKHYPTGYASSLHIKNLLNELKLKKNFVPDVVILDGLTNFASCKIPASQAGSTLYVKNVAEEQRALAIEMDYALLTLCQFNRGAKAKNEKADLEDIGEAYAIAQTADAGVSLIQTDELREALKYLVKVMKTRFGKNKGAVYTMGIDYDKMRLKNLAEKDQELPLHIKDALEYQARMTSQKEENIVLFDFDSE